MMKAAIQLTQSKGEFRVDSRLLAKHLGNKHQNSLQLVDRYIGKFELFGKVMFKTEPLPSGQKEKFALLNEDQAYFLLSLSRNTEIVVDLKAQLVLAFREARLTHDLITGEYLPVYHELHDQIHALAAGSEKERFAHMNINRLINKTVGIGPGQRSNLPQATHSLVVVASAIAANMHRNSKDTSEGYAKTKEALQPLESCRLIERTDQ